MQRKGIFLCVTAITMMLSCPELLAQKDQKATRYEDLKKSSRRQNATDLLEEASKIKTSDPEASLTLIEQALGISLTNKNILDEAKCYLLLGEINWQSEEWKLALENYHTAYEKLKPNYSDTPEFLRSLFGLSDANLKLGNNNQALQYYQETSSLKLSNAEMAQVQLGISEVYYQLEDYQLALTAVENIAIPKVSNSSLSASVQNQKAKIYARMNDVDRAREALQSSQNTLRSSAGAVPQAQEADLSSAKEEVVDVLHEQKRFDEEIDLRNQSIEYNLESRNLPEVSRDKIGIGKALAAKGETSAAIKELEEAALIADTIGNPKEQAKAFLALADLYEKNNRPTRAIAAYRRYSAAVNDYDSLNQTRLTEKAELIKKQRDIEELTKDVAIGQREETIAEGLVFRQQIIIYGLILIILVIAITSYFIYKNAQASKVANQLLALKSLRSQMNPHFIFNALNSVNQFIAQNDEKSANRFLSEFSRLMRLVMENSQEDFIPLDKEEEIISLYLKLEHYRFRDKFDYEIIVDDDINPEQQKIPPMLIQPYIENAVWHGLRYKEGRGQLKLHMRKNGNGIEVEITDDGIGRQRSAELKTVNQRRQTSTGLTNIRQRLEIINKVYKSNYRVEIQDLDGESRSGTRVVLFIGK